MIGKLLVWVRVVGFHVDVVGVLGEGSVESLGVLLGDFFRDEAAVGVVAAGWVFIVVVVAVD